MADKHLHRSEEYSISPTSGRLRKRIRKKKKSAFSKRKVKKYFEYFVWIVILIAFIYSLIIILPEIGLSDKTPKPKVK